MRFLYSTIFIFILSQGAIAGQHNRSGKVPAAVKEKFLLMFPAAKETTWKKEDNNDYEASFKNKSSIISASFTKDGKWLKTETVIQVRMLPHAVIFSIKKKFADYVIKEARRMENTEGNTCYKVELKKEKKKVNVIFTPTGKIKQEKTLKIECKQNIPWQRGTAT